MKIPRPIETALVALLASCCGAYLTHVVMLRSASSHGPSVPNAQDFEKSVANYIHQHPTVIAEALNAGRAEQAIQQQSRASASIRAHHAEIVADSSSPTLGAIKGDVVIAEFFDFRCSYCKNIAPLLERLLNRDRNVKIVFKNLPVLGPDSVYAARLGLGAARLGRFGDFYKVIFDTVPPHGDRATIDKAVRSCGLDPAVLYAHGRDRNTDDALRRDSQLAEALGISGTPALVIGETLLQGVPTEEQLVAGLAAARHK
jgi:protein-disulfide isomerase